mgnify:CR=1 FL=1
MSRIDEGELFSLMNYVNSHHLDICSIICYNVFTH